MIGTYRLKNENKHFSSVLILFKEFIKTKVLHD